MSNTETLIKSIAALPDDGTFELVNADASLVEVYQAAEVKSLVLELQQLREREGRLRTALEMARVRINRLAHVIKRDQNDLWDGTQLGPATEEDMKEIVAALATDNEEEMSEADALSEHAKTHGIDHHSINADGSCNMGCC